MRPKLMDWEGERVPKINEIWMLAPIKKSLKNQRFWRPKFKKIVKKRFQKPCFFRMRFLIVFGRVWGGIWEVFGKGLGPPGRLLGHF